ncbi:hypothetical protein [Marinomonas gallaica]|uniref:hypothetical protein n=1 Tax=Marinomonas gallaica TaxID=1806667 RepID=UPI003A8D9381
MDLSISPQERMYLVNEDLKNFWYSRIQKKDPIARIGYSLWCGSVENLKQVVNSGDPEYWDRKDYLYWDMMARTTVVNLSVGLDKAGFHGTFAERRVKIREIGVEIAKAHAKFVLSDIENKYGKTPGLLGKGQLARYHHDVFRQFGITPDIYGGTFLSNVPNEWEFNLYGDLYCHDCDTDGDFSLREAN